MRPLIGVISSITKETNESGEMQRVPSSYIRAVEDGGGVPVIIPLLKDEESLNRAYNAVSGLLFTGGDDVDPRLYGESPHPKLGHISPERDRVEVYLAKKAFLERKPVLAICRGIQVVNVALGGTLIQDIPSQFENSATHKIPEENYRHLKLCHSLKLEKNSTLAKLFGETELKTNSSHHQALKKIAPGLRVVGSSEDGIVEAVEGEGQPFFVGVQCHPEWIYESVDSRWALLFRGFVDACGNAREIGSGPNGINLSISRR